MRAQKSVHPFKGRGAVKKFTLFQGGGGGAKGFRPVIFPFCKAPSLPVINERFLRVKTRQCAL